MIEHYIKIRYNGTPTCAHCGSNKVYQKKDRPRVFHCADCCNTFSIFKDTMFEHTHTDLVNWYHVINEFMLHKKGIAALTIQRLIGVNYRTAWKMLHKIRNAMGDEDLRNYFKSIVEVDETYVGGKPRPYKPLLNEKGEIVKRKRGRGTTKTPVVGIVDRENKKVFATVAKPNKDGQQLSSGQLIKIIKNVVKDGATVMTDEFKGYNTVEKHGFEHHRIDHSSKKYSIGNIHTNSIESFWANLKRGVYCIYHSISFKYMQNYVNEYSWRHNNRQHPNIFELMLARTVVKNRLKVQ